MHRERSSSPWRRGLLAAATSLALLGVASSAQASPQVAGSGPSKPGSTVTFGIAPSSATGSDGRPYFYYGAAVGARVADHVVVVNHSAGALPLSVYATDGYNTYTGQQDLLAGDQKPADLGSWIHIDLPTRLVSVPGRHANGTPGTLVVPFHLLVPKGAEPGDHVAGVFVSLRALGRNARGVVVNLDQRIATEVFLRVAGALKPRLAIEQLKATYHGVANPFGTGKVSLSYVVHNTGNLRLGGRQKISVSGLFGSWDATTVADIPMLAPGGSAHLTSTIDGVWPEIWMTGKVRVVALGLASDANPPLAPVQSDVRFWAVPWTLLGLIALFVVIWWSRRRRRARPQDPAPRQDGPLTPEPQGVPLPPVTVVAVPAEPVVPPQPVVQPSSRMIDLDAPPPRTVVPYPAVVSDWNPDIDAPAHTWTSSEAQA